MGSVNFAIESGYIRPTLENIPFEDYLKGVVPNEMPASWNVEALKAQAVAARTYSVKSIGKVVPDTTAFQVYGDITGTQIRQKLSMLQKERF